MRKAVFALILLLLLWGSWLGSRWLLADLAIKNVERELENWNIAGIVPSLEIWTTTQTELENAKRLNKNEAEYYRLEGLLYEWRFFIQDFSHSVTEILAVREHTIDAYRVSASLRPAWPESWARLARQKALQGQIDEEFDLAIERATTLGAWDPKIHPLIAQAGAIQWLSLNAASRKAVLGNLQRGFSKNRTDIQLLNLLQANELFLNTLCPLLNTAALTKRVQRACEQAL